MNTQSDYKKTTIQKIKAEAKDNHGAIQVRHIFPRAYCVAKPAHFCAVFVTPPCDSEQQIKPPYSSSATVHNDTATSAEVGKWYSLAYCVCENGNQQTRVIFALEE